MSSKTVNAQSMHIFTVGIALLIAMPIRACELLNFDNAWVREPPPVSTVAAGYVTINNPTSDNVVISGVSSNCCRHLMFHETKMEAGQARMNHIEYLHVPANSQVSLEPLGKHLMLMGIENRLIAENTLEVMFSCGTADQTHVSFKINKQQ